MDQFEKEFNDLTGSFICKGCKHNLPINFCMRTPGYCYLCDPNVTVEELLRDTEDKSAHGETHFHLWSSDSCDKPDGGQINF